MNKRTTAILYTLLALGLLVIIVLAARGSSSSPTPGNSESGDVPTAAQITEADHTKGGTQTAPATLIEYGDFQCPACAAYAEVVRGISDQFGNRLRVVYRHYPLTQIHPNATRAAYATEAAGMQNMFWEMHDLLFERQGQWSNLPASAAEETFLNYAIELGLDGAQFKEDVESDAVRDKVAADTRSGNQLGVRGTPSFYLNGVKIDNPGSAQAFIDLIDAEIGDAQVAPVSASDLSQNPDADVYADFAVFLNGEQFVIDQQPEDAAIAALAEDGLVMHAKKEGVTVGYVFDAYGMTLTNDCLTTNQGDEFCSGDGNSLKFFVNGKRVQSLASYEFENQDQILISYGPLVDTTITDQLDAVTTKACEYTQDCQE